MEDTESSHAEMLPFEPLSYRLRCLARHFSAILSENSMKTNESLLFSNYCDVDINPYLQNKS
jgi:hypothetical protein